MNTPRRHSPAHQGFSLLEMIGVLALVGIFAAVITPNLAQSVSRSAGAKEDALLETIGDGLVDYVLSHQIIPNASQWATAVASTTDLSLDEVTYCNPSGTRSTRIYVIDPSFQPSDLVSDPGSFISISSSVPLWTQTSAGASTVANTRILILSVHKPGLYLPLKSGFASSSTAFENIWSWNLDPKTDAPPTGWSSDWTGNGEYLHVKRINLAPYFHRVTFSNTQYPTEIPYYQVGSDSVVLLSSASAFDALFLQGSFVRVYEDNESAVSPGALQISHTITGPDNFIYASDLWQMH